MTNSPKFEEILESYVKSFLLKRHGEKRVKKMVFEWGYPFHFVRGRVLTVYYFGLVPPHPHQCRDVTYSRAISKKAICRFFKLRGCFF
jgi:hypothetical protein